MILVFLRLFYLRRCAIDHNTRRRIVDLIPSNDGRQLGVDVVYGRFSKFNLLLMCPPGSLLLILIDVVHAQTQKLKCNH